MLSEAFAASAMNAASVLPDVGLFKLARKYPEKRGILRVNTPYHACLTMGLLRLSTIKPYWLRIIHDNLESGS